MSENVSINKNLMENSKIDKLVLKFAIPCVIAMVVSALYNFVDQIFIGQGVGYIGNAATNIAFPFVVLAQGVALLFGDGAAAFYSIKLGEGNTKDGAKGVGNAITMLISTGIIFLVIGYIFLEQLLWGFGATSTTIVYALDYMKITLISVPFTVIMCGLNSIIRADGNPQYGMGALLAGTIINLLLDPVFIFYFHMGVKGAAIATVIGEFISCMMCINYLRKFKNIKFNIRLLKLDFNIVKTIIIFGISTFITQLAVTFIIIVSNNMLAKYGA
ncbi:MAG TPA: MATE family efflux transporter, partial [Clostridium sp.]|nr:MATE family efflux transporter [Clostridium sp.]